jgi:hypothetical protein
MLKAVEEAGSLARREDQNIRVDRRQVVGEVQDVLTIPLRESVQQLLTRAIDVHVLLLCGSCALPAQHLAGDQNFTGRD